MSTIQALRKQFLSCKSLTRFSILSRFSSGLSGDFENAKTRLNTLTEDPGNEVKLQLYALFKQGTVGKCNAKKPGAFDLIGKAKWNAWNSLGDLSMDDAKKQYIDIVNGLAGGPEPASNRSPEDASAQSFSGLLITNSNGIYKITKNRPHRKNSLAWETYYGIIDALNEAAADPSVKAAVLTGAGDYYCSGNDLSNFANIPPEGPQKMAKDGRDTLRKYVKAYIDFPKPLIAAVNGPAIGVSVTALALCDLVYASDTATFHTPFMALGQSPEACSSLTFPRIMGYAKANEVLLMGKKLTAKEAFDRNLLTDVFPSDQFEGEINKRMEEIAALPPKSLQYSKALTRSIDKELLYKVNEIECERLEERWLSEECMNAIMAFMARKTK